MWLWPRGGATVAAVIDAALQSGTAELVSLPGLGVTGAAPTWDGVEEATLPQKSSALISALMSGNSGTTTLSMALRGMSIYVKVGQQSVVSVFKAKTQLDLFIFGLW